MKVESVSKRESIEQDRDWEGDREQEGDWEWEQEQDWEGDWERVGDDSEIEREIEKVSGEWWESKLSVLLVWVTDLGLSVGNRGHTRV